MKGSRSDEPIMNVNVVEFPLLDPQFLFDDAYVVGAGLFVPVLDGVRPVGSVCASLAEQGREITEDQVSIHTHADASL